MEWTDRVALVTGASSGIGLAAARAFVARGARVALVARGEERLAAAARELGERAVPFPLDGTDRAALAALPARVVERFGRLDMVVNNAGVNHRGPLAGLSAEQVAATLETNLIAPALLAHAALPFLSRGGAVVNVASLAGKVPVPDEACYSASKAGLRAFGRALASELRERGVTVSSVNPGPVDTPFFGNVAAVPNIVFSQPMSTPEEIARAIVRAVETGAREIDVPMLSGMLCTAGYLFPGVFTALRPSLERAGARKKARYMARKKTR
jgi:short-subunit dehydrogenase